ERPVAEHAIHDPALDRAQAAVERNRAPEFLHCLARALAAAFVVTARERDRIHRTRARASNAFKRETLVFQEPVEHAPGEGAVRAAALQGQVDDFHKSDPSESPGCVLYIVQCNNLLRTLGGA